MWTTNASKHTYKKKAIDLFPEISSESIEATAKKGIGAWARLLCEPGYQIHYCSGELQADQLKEIATKNRKKQKMDRTMPAPKESKMVKKKKKQKMDRTMPAPKKSNMVKKKKKKTPFFFSISKRLLKTVWSACLFFIRSILYRLITFTVWLSTSWYIFLYKGASHLTPELFQTLNQGQIFSWLFDWKTPGLPPEWGAAQTDLWASLHIWFHLVYQLLHSFFS